MAARTKAPARSEDTVVQAARLHTAVQASCLHYGLYRPRGVTDMNTRWKHARIAVFFCLAGQAKEHGDPSVLPAGVHVRHSSGAIKAVVQAARLHGCVQASRLHYGIFAPGWRFGSRRHPMKRSLIDGPGRFCYASGPGSMGFGTARGVVLCGLDKGCKQRCLAE